MTQISNKRVAELLGWKLIEGGSNLINSDVYAWLDPDGKGYYNLPNFRADLAWTGQLLKQYRVASGEPYLDKVFLALGRLSYKLAPEGAISPNEVIITALDALEEGK